MSEIAPDHDALICDIWGVVHNGQAPFPAAAEALRQFPPERGPVVLLSNAPRLPDAVAEQFRRIGVATDCYDAIVTSGGATREDLEPARARCHFIISGPTRTCGCSTGCPSRAPASTRPSWRSASGWWTISPKRPPIMPTGWPQMRARNLPMLCANPDLKVYRGAQLCWCAGALAKAYEELGGKVIYYGKPYPAIYQAALKAAGNPQKPAGHRRRPGHRP